jgi:hypothetical protein
VPLAISAAHVGLRVAVQNRGEGLLAFYGSTDFKDGTWCGVWLDQPLVTLWANGVQILAPPKNSKNREAAALEFQPQPAPPRPLVGGGF